MKQKIFGLIGKNIGHSFSKRYFTERFANDGLEEYSYQNFDIQDIAQFPEVLKSNPNLSGLNVTIPYKQAIIPYLDKLSEKAAIIGAVNTIKFTQSGKLKGYNTDWHGFKASLEPLLQPHHQKALILGTGGASKAVAFALDQLDILYTFVSRTLADNAIGYDRINVTTFDNYQIIINCTPIGMAPDTDACPPLPYEHFSAKHIAYDLIYNPEQTLFLQRAKAQGAATKNGYEMLVLQAQKAWKIWNR